MKLINGWRWMYKESDRLDINVRIGTVTLVRVYADISDRRLQLTLLNFRLELP